MSEFPYRDLTLEQRRTIWDSSSCEVRIFGAWVGRLWLRDEPGFEEAVEEFDELSDRLARKHGFR